MKIDPIFLGFELYFMTEIAITITSHDELDCGTYKILSRARWNYTYIHERRPMLLKEVRNEIILKSSIGAV